MVHTLFDSEQSTGISIELCPSKKVCISIDFYEEKLSIYLDKKQLHEFIGTSLHVQSKLK